MLSAIAAGVVAEARSSNPVVGIAAYESLGVPLGLLNNLIFALPADTVEDGGMEAASAERPATPYCP